MYESIPLDKVITVYEGIEHKCRKICIENGGSISHHHGVGKLRKRFMEQSVSPLNMKMLEGFKNAIDPKNIFGINNTIYRSNEEREED